MANDRGILFSIAARATPLLWGLTALLFAGCQSFDPTPYQQSLAKVRQVAAETVEYESRWHQSLMEVCEANHSQAMEVLKAKLIQEVFDNLLKKLQPLSADQQDVFFPIDGNRHEARMNWIKAINSVVTNHSVMVSITEGGEKPYDLIELYKEEKSASAVFTKLTAPQLQFYSDGIAKLKVQIVTLPLIAQHGKEFERLRRSIEAHKEFTSQLARQHGELEQEMIAGLQSAASALEANAWIVQIGNKALNGLNGLLGKPPQLPPTKTNPTENKP